MSEEAKCNCQRCGEHIEFSIVMAGQDVACPHCGRETTLILPTVRKAAPPILPASPQKQIKKNREQQPATLILMVIITIAAIIVDILIYNSRVNGITRALGGY
jgi:DNA-directed RNA polymerase subunit RPC12/RpoP